MFSKWIVVAMIFVPYLAMAQATAPVPGLPASVQTAPAEAPPEVKASETESPASEAAPTSEAAPEIAAAPAEACCSAPVELTQADLVNMVTKVDESEKLAAQNLEGVWVNTCYVGRDPRFPNARSSGPVYAFSSSPLVFVTGTGYFSDASCSNVEGILISQNQFLYDEVPTGSEYFNIAQPNIETLKEGASYKVFALWGITPKKQHIVWGRSASVELQLELNDENELVRLQPENGELENPQVYRRVTNQFPSIQQSLGKYLLVLKQPAMSAQAHLQNAQ